MIVAGVFSHSFAAIPKADQTLYTKVIESYRKGDPILLNKSVRLLLKTSPTSVHADNALYLNGMLALSKSEYRRAIKNFNLMLRFYPQGNKLAAAMVGKGIAYRKLGKKEKSQKAFNTVLNKFPGSPEYFQSQFQLKLLENE